MIAEHGRFLPGRSLLEVERIDRDCGLMHYIPALLVKRQIICQSSPMPCFANTNLPTS